MSPCHPRIDIPACSISLGIGMRSTIRDTLDIRASTDIKEYPVPSPYRYGAISAILTPRSTCFRASPYRHHHPSSPLRAAEQVCLRDTTLAGGVLSRACFRQVSVSIRVVPPIVVRDPRVDGDARRTTKRHEKPAVNTGIPTSHQ